jgi:hypothetical protein
LHAEGQVREDVAVFDVVGVANPQRLDAVIDRRRRIVVDNALRHLERHALDPG